MTQHSSFLYLHGLASTPASSKAAYLKAYFTAKGSQFLAPDLNVPTFETLSVEKILSVIASQLDELRAPGVLIGSSFGALMSLYALAQNADANKVQCLILLAPAFRMLESPKLPASALAAWRKFGVLPMRHQSTESERMLPVSFLYELETLPPVPPPLVPTLLIHGAHDETIRIEWSREWAGRHENVSMVEFDSDHDLTDNNEEILRLILNFLPAHIPNAGL